MYNSPRSIKDNARTTTSAVTSQSPTEPGDSFYFKEQKITDSPTQREQFHSIKEKFLDLLIDNLRSRFPDNGILYSFCLDPQNLPLESDMASYGNDQLEVLCAHYGTARLVAGSEEKLSPLVEPTSLKTNGLLLNNS